MLEAVVIGDARQVSGIGECDRAKRLAILSESAREFLGEVDRVAERATIPTDEHLSVAAIAIDGKIGDAIDLVHHGGLCEKSLDDPLRLEEGGRRLGGRTVVGSSDHDGDCNPRTGGGFMGDVR